MKKGFWEYLGFGGPKDKFSVERLQFLYLQLTRNEIVTESNKALVVETLRQIAELMIWGDQHNPKFFEFFLEKDIISFFLRILTQQTSKQVKVQLIQTLSIMMQNISSETSTFFLLSNNHINDLIEHRFDFTDEETLAYYMTFLKSLSLKLNKRSVQFFFNERAQRFPLYSEAVKFFNHEEGMVRIAVRTITLNVYKLEEPTIRQFILKSSALPYFTNLAWFVRNQFHMLDELVDKFTNGTTTFSKFEDCIAEQLDHLYYLNDILCLNIPSMGLLLVDRLLRILFHPFIVRGSIPTAAESVKAGSLRAPVSLFLLAQCFHIFSNSLLVNILGTLMVHPHHLELPGGGLVPPPTTTGSLGGVTPGGGVVTPSSSPVTPSTLGSAFQDLPDALQQALRAQGLNFDQPSKASLIEDDARSVGGSSADDDFFNVYSGDIPDGTSGLCEPNPYREALLECLEASDDRLVANAVTLLLTLLSNSATKPALLEKAGLMPRRLLKSRELLHELTKTSPQHHQQSLASSWSPSSSTTTPSSPLSAELSRSHSSSPLFPHPLPDPSAPNSGRLPLLRQHRPSSPVVTKVPPGWIGTPLVNSILSVGQVDKDKVAEYRDSSSNPVMTTELLPNDLEQQQKQENGTTLTKLSSSISSSFRSLSPFSPGLPEIQISCELFEHTSEENGESFIKVVLNERSPAAFSLSSSGLVGTPECSILVNSTFGAPLGLVRDQDSDHNQRAAEEQEDHEHSPLLDMSLQSDGQVVAFENEEEGEGEEEGESEEGEQDSPSCAKFIQKYEAPDSAINQEESSQVDYPFSLVTALIKLLCRPSSALRTHIVHLIARLLLDVLVCKTSQSELSPSHALSLRLMYECVVDEFLDIQSDPSKGLLLVSHFDDEYKEFCRCASIKMEAAITHTSLLLDPTACVKVSDIGPTQRQAKSEKEEVRTTLHQFFIKRFLLHRLLNLKESPFPASPSKTVALGQEIDMVDREAIPCYLIAPDRSCPRYMTSDGLVFVLVEPHPTNSTRAIVREMLPAIFVTIVEDTSIPHRFSLRCVVSGAPMAGVPELCLHFDSPERLLTAREFVLRKSSDTLTSRLRVIQSWVEAPVVV